MDTATPISHASGVTPKNEGQERAEMELGKSHWIVVFNDGTTVPDSGCAPSLSRVVAYSRGAAWLELFYEGLGSLDANSSFQRGWEGNDGGLWLVEGIIVKLYEDLPWDGDGQECKMDGNWRRMSVDELSKFAASGSPFEEQTPSGER